MMRFSHPEIDGALAAELRDAGLLAPDIDERIERALGRPEVGTLDDYLLAGADCVPEGPWLAWLIRRHGCHRFGRVGWSEQAGALAADGPPPGGNLPYRRCPGGALLVAVLRPDRRQETVRAHPAGPLLWAAATLRELRALHQAAKAARRGPWDE